LSELFSEVFARAGYAQAVAPGQAAELTFIGKSPGDAFRYCVSWSPPLLRGIRESSWWRAVLAWAMPGISFGCRWWAGHGLRRSRPFPHGRLSSPSCV